MIGLFEENIIDALATELSKWKSDCEIAKIYQWPIKEQQKQLKNLPEKYGSLAVEVNKGSSQLEKAFLLRQKITEVTFDLELSKWIIEDWGGITTGKDDGSLKACLKKADDKDFDFNRIASWSKHIAFKNPDQYAIYDARVIYSLNWLLFKAGANKYFPAPAGRNSVMELLDYRILLFIGHYKVAGVRRQLEIDIEERKKSPGRKSFVANKLKSELFIEPNEAFANYCKLLMKIAQKLYPNDQTNLRLTRVEMMLFSLADKDIALNVLDDFAKILLQK